MAIIMARLKNFCVLNMSVALNFDLFNNGASVAQGMIQDTDRKHVQFHGFIILLKLSATLVSTESAL